MMYIQWSMVSCMELVRRDHDVVQTECSMVWNWCEQTMMLYIQSGLWSHVWNWREETMLYTDRVVPGLMYETGEKRP